MPRSSLHTLIWSRDHGLYELSTQGQLEQRFWPTDEAAWLAWLGDVSSFAFHGICGRLNIYKEARPRGGQYWYAYHTTRSGTRKRYLGRTANVTLARLEQEAKLLSSEPSPAALVQEPIAASSQQRLYLLSSRLSPPHLPAWLVSRSRLLRELDAARSHPLTLVSASAGSGKTTLLSTWVAGSKKPQANGRRAQGAEPAIAWLSLDALDNDPIRFWASIIAALRTCLSELGEGTLALLHSPQSPPLSTVLTTLLEELLHDSREIILILDDYHLISDPAIHESMLFLLDHLPGCLHLVLSTRTDPELPLSRFRVRGQLIEVRNQDLRFSKAETTSFLVQSVGLSLSEEDMATLETRTEGWIAGLQLAALSMRKREDLSAFVKDFAGSHRYLLDYVQQDILAWLPVPLQQFLLQTSILTRMNAALCQVVTEAPSEPASQQMLEELERANLFVVPLDEQRQWYRFHDLFREALHARLHAFQPELVPLLHLRAASFYEAAGEWREAIAHALAAPDDFYAASLMEQAAPHFWLRGEASTVQNWVLSLPDRVLRAYARLALNAALRFINSVNLSTETVHTSMAAQVERTITRMEEILHSRPEVVLSHVERVWIGRRLRLLRALIEARVLIKCGDQERLRHLARELEALPQDEEVSWNMIPLSITFWLTATLQQEGALLVPRLLEARQVMMEAGDHLVTIRLRTWLADTYIQAGQLHRALKECLETLALVEQIGGHTAWSGYLYYSLFTISYARNRLEEASHWLQRLLRSAQDWQQVNLLVLGRRAQAKLGLASGDLSTAQEALYKLEALVEQERFADHARWVVDIRLHVWLAEAKLAKASEWAAQTMLFLDARGPVRREELLLLVRVSLAQQQYAQAARMLERWRRHLDQPGDIGTTIEWMALSVVALHQSGKRAQTMRVAARLLRLSEPEGYIRVYLDAGEPMKQVVQTLLAQVSFGSKGAARKQKGQARGVSISRSFLTVVLSAFKHEEEKHASRASTPLASRQTLQSEPAPATLPLRHAEPLSPQELRVLRLLVAGQSYAEMAEMLVVSINTIKTQVSSIYRKLGVNRRLEAIAATRRLHLLSPDPPQTPS